MKKSIILIALFAMIAAPVVADAGEWILRARVINVAPNDSSDPVLAFGGEVTVDDATTLELDLTYMFTKHFGLEVIAGTTEHDLAVAGGDLNGASLGSIKVLPPTLTLQWHPLPAGLFNLYLGVGVNWTMFYSYDLSEDLAGIGVTDLNFDDSFGFSGNIGLDLNLGEHFLINADVKYIQITTDVDVMVGNDALGTIGVDINPWVFGLGVGWRF